MKKGYVYAITSAVLFGTAGLFVKYVYKIGFSAIEFLELQYIISILILGIYILIFNRKYFYVNKRQVIDLAIMGGVGNCFMTLFYYKAFSYLPISMVTIILYAYSIYIFIYKIFRKKIKISLYKYIALFLALFGMCLSLNLIYSFKGVNLQGFIYALLCSIFYAFMNIYTEERLYNLESLTINFYSILFSLIVLVSLSFPIFLFTSRVSFDFLQKIVMYSVISEIIPLGLLYTAIKCIGTMKTSIISNLEIPAAIFFGYIILDEKVNFYQIIGGILIIMAIYYIEKE
ncbi:MAG: DMT family transporter [Clostridiaceae bacterium]